MGRLGVGSGGDGEMREGILGKIARIEEHLRDVIEVKCNRNFLNYIKVILIKSPNNGGDKFQMPSLANKRRFQYQYWVTSN